MVANFKKRCYMQKFVVRFHLMLLALVAGVAANAQAWTPTFDGVSATSIQGVLQSVLTSYQTWITAFLIFLGVIVGAAIVVAMLQKRSPVKM
jgi:uncharacterized membrane protein YcaP (DUF421 family)